MSASTILFVDDEKCVLHSYRRLLRKESFRVLTAPSGEEAIERLKTEEVHVLVTDQQMPGMSGAQLLAWVKQNHPDIVRVTISGYAGTEMASRTIRDGGIDRFLTKPWDNEELILNLRQCVTQYHLSQEQQAGALASGVSSEHLAGLARQRDRVVSDRILECCVDAACIHLFPLPTLVVDERDVIVSVHESVARKWPELSRLAVGGRVHESACDCLSQVLADAKIGRAASRSAVSSWLGIDADWQAKPVFEEGEYFGAVVLLEAEEEFRSKDASMSKAENGAREVMAGA